MKNLFVACAFVGGMTSLDVEGMENPPSGFSLVRASNYRLLSPAQFFKDKYKINLGELNIDDLFGQANIFQRVYINIFCQKELKYTPGWIEWGKGLLLSVLGGKEAVSQKELDEVRGCLLNAGYVSLLDGSIECIGEGVFTQLKFVEEKGFKCFFPVLFDALAETMVETQGVQFIAPELIQEKNRQLDDVFSRFPEWKAIKEKEIKNKKQCSFCSEISKNVDENEFTEVMKHPREEGKGFLVKRNTQVMEQLARITLINQEKVAQVEKKLKSATVAANDAARRFQQQMDEANERNERLSTEIKETKEKNEELIKRNYDLVERIGKLEVGLSELKKGKNEEEKEKNASKVESKKKEKRDKIEKNQGNEHSESLVKSLQVPGVSFVPVEERKAEENVKEKVGVFEYEGDTAKTHTGVVVNGTGRLKKGYFSIEGFFVNDHIQLEKSKIRYMKKEISFTLTGLFPLSLIKDATSFSKDQHTIMVNLSTGDRVIFSSDKIWRFTKSTGIKEEVIPGQIELPSDLTQSMVSPSVSPLEAVNLQNLSSSFSGTAPESAPEPTTQPTSPQQEEIAKSEENTSTIPNAA